MTKRLISMISLSALTIMLSLVLYQSTQAMGGGWVVDNGSFSRIEQVCRDGYQMTHAPLAGSNVEPTNGNTPVRFGYKVNNDWFDDSNTIPFNHLDHQLFKEYHGYIGPTLSLQEYGMRVEEPIETNQGSVDYYFKSIFPFSRPLPVGFHVGFAKANVYDIWTVEDCYLLTLDGAQDQTIDVSKFMNPGYPSIDSADLIVTIDEVPTGGVISVGGTQLEEGTTFRLGAAEISDLTYTARAMPPNEDHLTFAVRGTYRVSLDDEGNQIDSGDSYDPSISADGSAVSFTTEGTGLVSGFSDNNGAEDIYLTHYQFGEWEVELVSRNSVENWAGNGRSYNSDISGDGRVVTYVSAASDLISGNTLCDSMNDTNGVRDIYKWAENGATNARVSMFNFDNPSLDCTEIGARSLSPTVADARNDEKVAYQTLADFPNLVYTSDNSASDILFDDNGATNRLYVANDSLLLRAPDARSYAAEISADGNFVAFTSDATNLFTSDTNGHADVGIRDLSGGITRISVAPNGSQAVGGGSTLPSISQLGQHIAFQSRATNLSDADYNSNNQIYVHDTETGCTQLLTPSTDGVAMANGASINAQISADGRFVAFESTASNLVSGDTNGASDIFIIDRDSDQNHSFYAAEGSCDRGPFRVIRVSVAGNGTEANGGSYDPALSDNGDFVAFSSDATNLISGDSNGLRDVFVHYVGYSGEIRFSAGEFVFLPFVVKP